MVLKKLFFPIGAGEELRERIHGALLVNKFFGTHMEILACQLDPETVYNVRMTLRGGIVFDEFLASAKAELKNEQIENEKIFKEECEKLGVASSSDVQEPNSASIQNKIGLRTKYVARHSKYCDLVVAAVPPTGEMTGTFEAAVIKSGRPCIVIPRVMKKFSADKILVSITGTTASAKALGHSIDLLRKAKKVHCIMAKSEFQEGEDDMMSVVKEYLEVHGIKATYEFLTTDGKRPGEMLIKTANDGDYDLIVAGAQADNGIREMFLGGTSKYFLQNTKIPVLM